MNLVSVALLLLVSSHAQDDKDGEGECTNIAPPLPGVMPRTNRTHLILAQGVGYPPYASAQPLAEGGELTGFGLEVALSLGESCGLDIDVTETQWIYCWGNNEIGEGLDRGDFHACMNYFNAQGIRERYVEFGKPILDDNTPDALLTRLDENGNPVVSSTDLLQGKVVVDMPGFAPTADQLPVVQNFCVEGDDDRFQGYTIIPPIFGDGPVEDDALRTLVEGFADVLWIAAGQAESYRCGASGDVEEGTVNISSFGQGPVRNCTLWDGLGTTYAYVHTGMIGQDEGGTTLTMSKIGSGVADLVNPCLEKFLQTEDYYRLCAKYGLVDTCFQNDFFPTNGTTSERPASFTPTDQLETSCSDGYCPCGSVAS